MFENININQKKNSLTRKRNTYKSTRIAKYSNNINPNKIDLRIDKEENATSTHIKKFKPVQKCSKMSKYATKSNKKLKKESF